MSVSRCSNFLPVHPVMLQRSPSTRDAPRNDSRLPAMLQRFSSIRFAVTISTHLVTILTVSPSTGNSMQSRFLSTRSTAVTVSVHPQCCKSSGFCPPTTMNRCAVHPQMAVVVSYLCSVLLLHHVSIYPQSCTTLFRHLRIIDIKF